MNVFKIFSAIKMFIEIVQTIYPIVERYKNTANSVPTCKDNVE